MTELDPRALGRKIEIRNNEDGSLDEIVITVGGECVFHLEQMDTNRWWMGCYDEPKAAGVMVFLNARGKISATVMDERRAALSSDRPERTDRG